MRNYLPAALFLLACGCHSHRALQWAPFDVAAPGVKVWAGQAVWRPMRSMPELTGDVTVALQPDGSAFIQFSKTLPFATAREDGRRWQIDFPQGRRYSGHYPLPHHFAWLQLPEMLEGRALHRPWNEHGAADDFVIENHRAGETLHGFLSPNP